MCLLPALGSPRKSPRAFAIKLGETAESLGISRHRLTVLALFAGLDIAAAQLRAEQATKATKRPPAAPSSKEE